MAKMFDSPDMRETIRRLIRAQMALKGYEYRDLSRALHDLGVEQLESNLRSKINSGSLGAQLFIYILMALDVQTLRLTDVAALLDEVAASTQQEKHT